MIDIASIFKKKDISKYDNDQKTAMVELAIITMYLDKKIKISENDKIVELSEALGWKYPNELQRLIENTSAKARSYKSISNIPDSVFEQCNVKLKNIEAKKAAIDLCAEVSKADNQQEFVETAFIAKLKAKFNSW